MSKIPAVISDDKGAAGLEYALLVSLVGMVIISGLQMVRVSMQQVFPETNGTLAIINLLDEKPASR